MELSNFFLGFFMMLLTEIKMEKQMSSIPTT